MIQGRIVQLRPIELHDLAFLQQLANDPQTAAMLVGWDFPVSMHGQEGWLMSNVGPTDTKRLIIQQQSGPTVIGTASLSELDWHNRSACVSVKIAQEYRKRGGGVDAMMTLAAWAFYVVGLRRLYSKVMVFNSASMSTFVKHCGWRVEGRELESVFRKGQWCDLYLSLIHI